MSDENTQPSSVPAETEVKQTASTDTPNNEPEKLTMADVAKKFNVEDEAKNFNPQIPQPQQPNPNPNELKPYFNVQPDPITDPDGFRKYNEYQSTILNGTLRELASTVTEMKKQAEQEKLNVEVNKAIAKVNEKLKVDPIYTEILLEKKYRDDPIFRRIWDNRKVNPKALDAALEVITSEASGVFQVRSDPQLVENQRAAKASQKAMSSTTKSQNDDVMNMSEAEFDHWWATNRR